MNRSNSSTKNSQKTLAVIPARGGSLRIPKKNLADFGGKPAIARVIEIARCSRIFERIVISTDDLEIASEAEVAGAAVIHRPQELSDDFTPLQPVVVHAINQVPTAQFVCLILATAILLRPERLRVAYSMLLKDPQLDYVIGIRRFGSPPQRGITLDEQGFVSMQSPEFLNARSQDLTPLYHDAGQFSFGRRKSWLSGQSSFVMRTRAIELSRGEAVDIDEPDDLIFARRLFEAESAK